MHPDRKIGIAMGILLVGVVAALFFRNEPLVVDDGLSLRRENELNQRLQDRDVTIFANDSAADQLPAPTDHLDWSQSEMLTDLQVKQDASPTPIGSASSLAARRAMDENGNEPLERLASRTADESSSDLPPTESEVTYSTAGAAPSDSSSNLASNAAPQQFTEYTVKFGDTLSEISERFLGSQGRYREIYDANKDRMSSPDQLKVGKAIRIPRVLR